MELQWHLLPWEVGQVLGLSCLLLGPLQAVPPLLPAPIWSSEQEPPQVRLFLAAVDCCQMQYLGLPTSWASNVPTALCSRSSRPYSKSAL